MTEIEWLTSVNPHAMLEVVAGTEPGLMRRWISWLIRRRGQYPSRKMLLFAVACCRRIESLLVDDGSRYALAMAEKQADGLASRREWSLAKSVATAAAFDANGSHISVGGWLAAAQARSADAVAGLFAEKDPAGTVAAIAREAIRAWKKGAARSGQLQSNASTWLVANSWSRPIPESDPMTSEGLSPEQVAWTEEGKMQCHYIRDLFGNPFRKTPTNNTIVPDAAAIALAKSIYDERSFSRLPELADALRATGIEDPEILAHCCQAEHIRGCWAVEWLLGR